MRVPNEDRIEGAAITPYAMESMRVEYVRKDPPLPITFWRSVGPGHNNFVVEGMIDELAEQAGVDPVEFRRRVLKPQPSMLGVLNLVAEKASWGTPLPERRGRGVALQSSFGSSLAAVIEAEVDDEGHVRLHRVIVVVDCGQAVNPRGVMTQIEGGVIYGISAALWGRIDIANGQILQSNFCIVVGH